MASPLRPPLWSSSEEWNSSDSSGEAADTVGLAVMGTRDLSLEDIDEDGVGLGVVDAKAVSVDEGKEDEDDDDCGGGSEYSLEEVGEGAPDEEEVGDIERTGAAKGREKIIEKKM